MNGESKSDLKQIGWLLQIAAADLINFARACKQASILLRDLAIGSGLTTEI